MPYSPLATRFSSLPLVLCGPILRRTTASEVSVWIALKTSDSLFLEVFDESGASVAQSYSTPTTALGDNIHVCVLSALPSVLAPLTEGINYTYDITFTQTITGTLDTVGVLYSLSSGISSITYANSGFLLPSFSLPPSDINMLHLVHASCRKPHGQGLDALEGLNEMISKVLEDPNKTKQQKAQSRPHQLFLTGDQIYSDDVADALLILLRDAADYLLGWNENLPGTYTAPDPGHRGAFVRSEAGFTSTPEDCKSHLITLGEFYCMYLFAFSDVLWPSTLPDLTDMTYLNDYPFESTFADEIIYLNNFKGTLEEVKRAIANIPTYMIFDDHEITDDWYLNGQWYTDVSSKSLGKRIMANGLSAYSIFQDWGNRPDYYTYGAGLDLLTKLEYINTPIDFDAVQDLVLPIATTSGSPGSYLVLGPQSGGMEWHYRIEMPKYEILVLDSRTRRGFPGSLKDYPALIDPSHMATQIPAPYSITIEFTLIISPAPIFGMPRMDALKSSPINLVEDFTGVDTPFKAYSYVKFIDGEAWGLRTYDTVQDLLSHFTARAASVTGYKSRIILLSGDVHYGYTVRTQYWATDPKGSSFPALNQPDEYNIVMAQLTASALKNEKNSATGSYNIQRNGYNREFLTTGILDPIICYGYEAPSGSLIIGLQTGMPSTQAAPLEVEVPNVALDGKVTVPVLTNGVVTQNQVSIDPHWRYRTDFMYDGRPTLPPPAQFNQPVSNNNGQLALGTYNNVAAEYIGKAIEWGEGLEGVGVNNIGEITFYWPALPSDAQKVTHNIWRRQDNLSDIKSDLTIHEVSLSYQDSTYYKPQP